MDDLLHGPGVEAPAVDQEPVRNGDESIQNVLPDQDIAQQNATNADNLDQFRYLLDNAADMDTDELNSLMGADEVNAVLRRNREFQEALNHIINGDQQRFHMNDAEITGENLVQQNTQNVENLVNNLESQDPHPNGGAFQNPHQEAHGEEGEQNIMERCGACRFSKTRCSSTCIFRPYFPNAQQEDFRIILNSASRNNLKRRLSRCPQRKRAEFLNLRRMEGLIIAKDYYGGCAAALNEKDTIINELREELKRKDIRIAELTKEKDKIAEQSKSLLNLSEVTKTQQQQFHAHQPQVIPCSVPPPPTSSLNPPGESSEAFI